MSRTDKIALVISILAFGATAWISLNIFEGIPHLEDEFAYVWQAQVISRGELTIPSPPEHKSFLVPFVVDHEGQRFGKYPLGWPAILSLGERINIRWLVNPILAGLVVWLTYRLGTKALGEVTGLIAAVLTATSPFFLMNSGSLLSHPWGLLLSTAFVIFWFDTTGEEKSLPEWLPPLAAGLTLGAFALSRPFTALGVAFPFGIHGLFLLFRGSPQLRKKIIMIGLISVLVSSFHLVWQYTATGDPLLNPYTLWWEYDKIGFGPGVGVTKQGHNLGLAWDNLEITLNSAYSDLFGWFKVSWLFLPFGIWAVRRKRKAMLISSVFPVLVILYMAYWIGAWVMGPRYYYEGLYSLTLLTAAGIVWLISWEKPIWEIFQRPLGWENVRTIGSIILIAFLIAGNLIFYMPGRIGVMKGLFGTSRQQLVPFQTSGAGVETPALIIVDTDEWRAYAGLLELAHPMLDSPYIFTWYRGPISSTALAEAFPDRNIYHYFPEEPWVLHPIKP